jgi:hypothetical protein
MYGEGGPQPVAMTQFDQAKAANQLLTLRSLEGNFSEESDRASLSYTESYSVVNFLIKAYGRDKMTALLTALRNGASADEALYSVYGFDTDGLEDTWRTSIGAAPSAGISNPTPVFTATQVPTFVPVGAAPVAPANPTPRLTQVQVTATPITTTQAPGSKATSIPLAERLGISSNVVQGVEIGLICCILMVVVIAVLVIVTSRRHSRRQK